MVQAIVAQTLRRAQDLDTASRAVAERLSALAKTQSTLAQGRTAANDLAVLVDDVVALHGGAARIRPHGPPVRLDERTALGAGLVLHELSTNATKYGALSNEGGHVAVDWAVDADGGTVDLLWREIGGPPVTPPQRRGFGSTLIERSLSTRAGNSVTIDYAPDGLVCRWRLALTKP
jgi:two-component sensor histidine kinase